MRNWGLVCVLLLTVSAAPMLSIAAGVPYIGIQHEVCEEPPGLKLGPVPGAPGAVAGLIDGDVLLGIDGVMFADNETPYAEQLTGMLAEHEVGDTLTFHIYRNAPVLSLKVGGEEVATDYPLDELAALIEAAGLDELVELNSV